jgi:hypothetical protein
MKTPREDRFRHYCNETKCNDKPDKVSSDESIPVFLNLHFDISTTLYKILFAQIDCALFAGILI